MNLNSDDSDGDALLKPVGPIRPTRRKVEIRWPVLECWGTGKILDAQLNLLRAIERLRRQIVDQGATMMPIESSYMQTSLRRGLRAFLEVLALADEAARHPGLSTWEAMMVALGQAVEEEGRRDD